MTAETRTNTGVHPYTMFMVLLITLVLSVGIMLGGKLAIYGLLGALLFIVFVSYPVLGLYATTIMLLLSGSSGIVGFVGDSSAIAVTGSKLCGTAALAAWLINLLSRKLRLEFNPPIMLLTAFCGWALVGSVLSLDPSQTISEWVRVITILGFFFLAVNTLNTTRNLHTFILIILMCGLAMAAIAVVQYVLPQYHIAIQEAAGSLGAIDGAYIDQESLQGEAALRVSGRTGHSNWLAMFLLVVLPLNAYWFAVAKSNKEKLLAAATAGIEVVALVLTYTRTGLVVAIVIAAMMVIKRFVRITPQRIIAFLLAMVIAWILLPGAYKERVLSPKQYTGSRSVQSRMALQTAAARYSFENPVTGLGLGGFGLNFTRENNDTAQTMKWMVQHRGWQEIFIGTHNLYLQIACDTGYVGLILFLGFYVTMLRAIYQAEDRFRKEGDKQGEALASSLFISLIGFLFIAVFLHALSQKIWWMVAAAAVVIPLYRFSFKEPMGPMLPWKAEADRD